MERARERAAGLAGPFELGGLVREVLAACRDVEADPVAVVREPAVVPRLGGRRRRWGRRRRRGRWGWRRWGWRRWRWRRWRWRRGRLLLRPMAPVGAAAV